MTATIGPQVTSGEWTARLASLVHTLRPDWDEAGIRSTLAKVADRPLIDVASAAVAACRRTDQRTPAVIALDGKHWHIHGAVYPASPAPSSVIVTRCGHNLVGAVCTECHPAERRGVPMPDDVRTQVAQRIAEGKAAMAARDQKPPPSAHNPTETDAHT